MQTRGRTIFATIRTEGAMLPADLLQRIVNGDRNLEGLSPDAYHLTKGEKLNEAASHAWNRLVGAWLSFAEARTTLPAADLGTTITRERWLLPLFSELGYGRLLTTKAIEVDGKSYPISHGWQHTPIHLVGCRVDLDHRAAGVAGASRSAPHGIVQELLNRSDAHLWGFVSNGLKLRILRDNSSLTRQAYVEFDLEAMMEGEAYADFVLLWLLCHESRVEAERPEDCCLERWSRVAQEQGTRALEQLRKGVEEAITALGRGFLAHSTNLTLKEKLRAGTLTAQDYYRQLLRLVYRLLFLFVAEDRDVLCDPKAEPAARERYKQYYSTARLRRLAERRLGTRHADLYHGLRLVMEKLGSDTGCPELGLPALGSFLFSAQAIPDLDSCEIANHDLLDAIRSLAFANDGHSRRVVDYKNLGSEELGSVYESLLELHPLVNIDAGTFELQTAGGHERKTTGSYYTPSSLIQCLLDSALDPVLEEATRQANPEAAILRLKICDPACGSGHFLIAAAHRVAKRLAAVRTGDNEPAPEATRTALRDVIGHCIYGVDLNPMAVELCKVSLWMEALEPGKPLSFLDHRIQCGNSLLGTTPALLLNGIPDEALDPIEGDDKEVCRMFKKQNKEERTGQGSLFDAADQPWERLGDFAVGLLSLEEIDDATIAGIRQKQEQYEHLVRSSDYLYGRLLADAWCAAFVWKKTKEFAYPITEEVFRRIERSPFSVALAMRDEILRLAQQYQFFHWHLAFPDVFRLPTGSENNENGQAGWVGGFDVVLGNPPWEQIQLDPREFFAFRFPTIASAAHMAARNKAIAELVNSNPNLYREFSEETRKMEGTQHIIHASGRYPLTNYGRLNSAPLFCELGYSIVSLSGRVGLIVPTGIATDSFNQYFFRSLMEANSLVSLYDFENREGLFPIVDSRMKFCLITLTGSAQLIQDGADFVFFAHSTDDLRQKERHIAITAKDIAVLNPNTRTCPIFRSRRDADLAKAIYSNIPVLINENNKGTGNLWGFRGLLMFMMNTASHLFRTKEQLENNGWHLCKNVFQRGQDEYLPLYEGRMIHHFDHRAASVGTTDKTTFRSGVSLETSLSEHSDPNYLVVPRYWVEQQAVQSVLPSGYKYKWLLGFKDITSATNERTFIATVLPLTAVGNSVPLVFANFDSKLAAVLVACLSSFVVDFVSRFKIGGNHLNFFILNQLPILPPANYNQPCQWFPPPACQSSKDWLLTRVLELVYTARDLEPFAQDCGYDGPPFRWDENRRFLLRCELDAAYFHLYGIARDDMEYIMETFPIVKRKDEQKYGEYRTKRVILEIYDAMAEAIRTGAPYQTLLDPPPADPRVAHSSLQIAAW